MVVKAVKAVLVVVEVAMIVLVEGAQEKDEKIWR